MGIRKHIPNAITCCNLLCGCLAIYLHNEALVALLFVLLAAMFDFLDGLAARSLKAYSPIGKDLDSLADMVSFGVAPAFVGLGFMSKVFTAYFGDTYWIARFLYSEGLPEVKSTNAAPLTGGNYALAIICWLIPLLIAVFSALRLAKFNNDKRQTENFRGLATPACALLYISLVAILRISLLLREVEWSIHEAQNPAFDWIYWLPAIVVPVLCWLLVSEIPMFSMKFRNLSWLDNRDRYIFLMIVAVEIVMAIVGGFSFPALIVAVITTYIIINLLMLAFPKKKAKQSS